MIHLFSEVWSLQAEEDEEADETNVNDQDASADSLDREEL